MDKEERLLGLLAEARAEASKCVDYLEEALVHLRGGDVQSSCNVANLMHYPLGHMDDAV